jgi:hypothetical protein
MQAIFWSTLLAGALDITAAIVLRGLVNGVAASRVLQSVASGVLGRAAFSGGQRAAAFGLLLHFLIMAGIAATFYVASRRLPSLTAHWPGFGLAYGVVVYLVMSFVIVPLSGFPGKLVPSVAAFVEGALVHAICVGLPIAFATSRYAQSHG